MFTGVTRLKVLRYSSDIEISFLDLLKLVSSTLLRICVLMFLERRLFVFFHANLVLFATTYITLDELTVWYCYNSVVAGCQF